MNHEINITSETGEGTLGVLLKISVKESLILIKKILIERGDTVTFIFPEKKDNINPGLLDEAIPIEAYENDPSNLS